MSALEEQNATLSETLSGIDSSTKEIIQFFSAFKGAFKVLEMMAKLARPLGAIILLMAAIASAWSALKGGGPFK